MGALQALSQEGMDLDEAEHRVAQMHENVNAIIGMMRKISYLFGH